MNFYNGTSDGFANGYQQTIKEYLTYFEARYKEPFTVSIASTNESGWDTLKAQIERNDTQNILQIRIYRTTTRKAYTETLGTELKTVSNALKASIKHKVRVFKAEHWLVLVTNYLNEGDILKKFLTLIPTILEIPKETYDQQVIDLLLNKPAALTSYLKQMRKNDEKYMEQLKKDLEISGLFSKQGLFNALEKDLSNTRANIQDTAQSLERYYQLYSKQEEALFAAQTQTDYREQLDELITFLKSNKCITDVHISKDSSKIVVQLDLIQKITHFDQNFAKKALENPNATLSYLNKSLHGLYEDLFLNETYKLWVSCRIILYINTNGTITLDYGASDSEYIPHTHLRYYRCLGGYENRVYSAAQKKDLVTLISLLLGVITNFNLADGTVMTKLKSTLLTDYTDCATIETKEGNFITPNEYFQIKQLEEKERVKVEMEQQNTNGTTTITREAETEAFEDPTDVLDADLF